MGFQVRGKARGTPCGARARAERGEEAFTKETPWLGARAQLGGGGRRTRVKKDGRACGRALSPDQERLLNVHSESDRRVCTRAEAPTPAPGTGREDEKTGK